MCDRFSDYIVGSRHTAQMSSMHVFICMTGTCIKRLHISVEMETKVRKDFTITKKTPIRA